MRAVHLVWFVAVSAALFTASALADIPAECAAICAGADCSVDTDQDGFPDLCDQCPSDPQKHLLGVCGCDLPDSDSDLDGIPDCQDGCPFNAQLSFPTFCGGCVTPEPDSDGDGVPDCLDSCPNNPQVSSFDMCGCLPAAERPDSDGDGVADCLDQCPDDAQKSAPGACGCGVADSPDVDGDGTPDCADQCPVDSKKTLPGVCGCGTPDTDSDHDGRPDCLDGCPADPLKLDPGACGCGVRDIDCDADGVADCLDDCPADPKKTAPGLCGCGVPDSQLGNVTGCHSQCPTRSLKATPGICGCEIADTDLNRNRIVDCLYDSELRFSLRQLRRLTQAGAKLAHACATSVGPADCSARAARLGVLIADRLTLVNAQVQKHAGVIERGINALPLSRYAVAVESAVKRATSRGIRRARSDFQFAGGAIKRMLAVLARAKLHTTDFAAEALYAQSAAAKLCGGTPRTP